MTQSDDYVTADKQSAAEGETVTLSLGAGMAWADLDISSSPEISLTDGANSTKTFVMPAEDVEILIELADIVLFSSGNNAAVREDVALNADLSNAYGGNSNPYYWSELDYSDTYIVASVSGTDYTFTFEEIYEDLPDNKYRIYDNVENRMSVEVFINGDVDSNTAVTGNIYFKLVGQSIPAGNVFSNVRVYAPADIELPSVTDTLLFRSIQGDQETIDGSSCLNGKSDMLYWNSVVYDEHTYLIAENEGEDVKLNYQAPTGSALASYSNQELGFNLYPLTMSSGTVISPMQFQAIGSNYADNLRLYREYGYPIVNSAQTDISFDNNTGDDIQISYTKSGGYNDNGWSATEVILDGVNTMNMTTYGGYNLPVSFENGKSPSDYDITGVTITGTVNYSIATSGETDIDIVAEPKPPICIYLSDDINMFDTNITLKINGVNANWQTAPTGATAVEALTSTNPNVSAYFTYDKYVEVNAGDTIRFVPINSDYPSVTSIESANPFNADNDFELPCGTDLSMPDYYLVVGYGIFD